MLNVRGRAEGRVQKTLLLRKQASLTHARKMLNKQHIRASWDH